MSRVVLIGGDSVLEHQARRLLGDDVVALAPASSDVIVTRLIWLDRRPELVVLGTGMPTDLALSLARTVRELADVVALATDEPEIRSAATAAGIDEFLSASPDLEEFDALLDRARHRVAKVRGIADGRQAEPVRPGRIVVVTSPKGGVGKTTVACNLAIGLAENDPGQVVIVDLDLQFGDVATVLGIEARHSVLDALGKSAARDDFIMRTFLVEHPDGISVLTAPESPATADRVEAGRVGHLLRQLASRYHHVIVDTAPGLGDHALAAIEQAAAIVAVVGPDVTSVRGLRKSFDLLRELQLLPASHPVVLNGVDRGAGMTAEDAETVLGVRVEAAIPRRRAVVIAGNRGVPVLRGAPRDPASRALRSLVRRLDDGLTRREWRDDVRRRKVS
jgi:pilus assembly protein CpaE